MALPSSGAISVNAINVELGKAGTTQSSLGQTDFRTLAGVASGEISMSNFHGKSNIITGVKCHINNVAQFLQFGYNVLGAVSAAIKPKKLHVYVSGRYNDDPWQPKTIYLYGIRASDGGRDLLWSATPNSRDWIVGNTFYTLPGTVAYTNLNFYHENDGPKANSTLSAYFSEWTL